MSAEAKGAPAAQLGWIGRALAWIERIGNKLPDPAVLFLIALVATWVLSHFLAKTTFDEIDPRTGAPIVVRDQLQSGALASFLAGEQAPRRPPAQGVEWVGGMVRVFMEFPPLGVVLVALLGIGVAEHAGLINAALKWLLSFTPRFLLTPMLVFVAILSHSAVDAGYVLVIPLGGVIFYAAGRHPLAGIAAAFAGVSGGFSANPVPSSLDPLLQGFTQRAAQMITPTREVNPLCNWYFTGASTLLIVLLAWWITDRVISPRLERTKVDGDPAEMPKIEELGPRDRPGLVWALVSMLAVGALFVFWALPAASKLRDATGALGTQNAPLMQSIVPLIFILFVVPGIVFGYVSGSIKGHRDVIQGMTKSMSGMGYYLVMAFFAALFIDAFAKSNLGALLALKGAAGLRALGLPGQVTVLGIILLTASVNLLIGSASAKWALLSPIFVPMLMQVGISPELTQAAYRVGDSTTNIVTPLMPYFPLVVVFCTRYVKNTGIGTLVSLMLPYTVTFLVVWTFFLLGFWALGIPLGLGATYTHP